MSKSGSKAAAFSSKDQRSVMQLFDKLRDEAKADSDAITEDSFSQESVLDIVDFTSAEPSSPAVGDRYINSTNGVSNVTEIAVYEGYVYQYALDSSNNGYWDSYSPKAGDTLRDIAEGRIKMYNGSSWEYYEGILDHDSLLNADSVVESVHVTQGSIDNMESVIETRVSIKVGSTSQVAAGSADITLANALAALAEGDGLYLLNGTHAMDSNVSTDLSAISIISQSQDAIINTDTYTLEITGEDCLIDIYVVNADNVTLNSIGNSFVNGSPKSYEYRASSESDQDEKLIKLIKRNMFTHAMSGSKDPTVEVLPVTGSTGALRFSGTVFDPIRNRIYGVPYQLDGSQYYLDCETEELGVAGTLSTGSTYAYKEGIYSHTLKKIILIPRSMGSNSTWHRIDCVTGAYESYAHGASVQSVGYLGGVYSPTQDRIYMSPANQGPQSTWHYIDCSDGSVVGYAHGTGISTYTAYSGGAYLPSLNRIYFAPYTQAAETTWHYVNCDTGAIVSYAHGQSFTYEIQAYHGAVYNPILNRVYFCPYQQEDYITYIDGSDGSVHAIEITASADEFDVHYEGGMTSPVDGRTYFTPYRNSDEDYWDYIDPITGERGQYATQYLTATEDESATGFCFDPIKNRMYLFSWEEDQTELKYLQFNQEVKVPSSALITLS